MDDAQVGDRPSPQSLRQLRHVRIGQHGHRRGRLLRDVLGPPPPDLQHVGCPLEVDQQAATVDVGDRYQVDLHAGDHAEVAARAA